MSTLGEQHFTFPKFVLNIRNKPDTKLSYRAFRHIETHVNGRGSTWLRFTGKGRVVQEKSNKLHSSRFLWLLSPQQVVARKKQKPLQFDNLVDFFISSQPSIEVFINVENSFKITGKMNSVLLQCMPHKPTFSFLKVVRRGEIFRESLRIYELWC